MIDTWYNMVHDASYWSEYKASIILNAIVKLSSNFLFSKHHGHMLFIHSKFNPVI